MTWPPKPIRMKPATGSRAVHLTLVGAAGIMLVLCMVYPFLPGGYDRLAVPLSTMAQVFGVVGLALVPVGLLWLIDAEVRHSRFLS